MPITHEQTNTIERINTLIVSSLGSPVINASVFVRIRRKDGKFWNGTAFQTGLFSIAMLQVNLSTAPGEYFYDFNTTGLLADTYYIRVESADGANVPQLAEIKVGGFIDFVDRPISSVMAAGGGFFIGANNLFWTSEEKEEIIAQVRKLAFAATELQDGQKKTEVVIMDIVTWIKALDKLVKDHKKVTEIVASSVGDSATKMVGDFGSIMKRSLILLEEVKNEGSSNLREVLGSLEGIKDIRTKVIDLKDQLLTTQNRNAARLQDIEIWVKDSSEVLEDMFKLTVKALPTDSLKDLIVTSAGGAHEKQAIE